jgi:hypothetical protein
MNLSKPSVLCRWLALLPALLPAVRLPAQHFHLNAGATAPVAGTQLYFANGNLFATNSGFVLNLVMTNAGPYRGYHQGSLTFTALPATPDVGGPAFGHAALGAFLELRIESLDGPKDGAWGFWEGGDVSPRFSVPVGTRAGANRFALSEGDATPGSDPFGHIHGRVFTATRPGLYVLGVRIIDTSSNGPDGGPLHTPSDLFRMYVQAGLTIDSMGLTDSGVHLVLAGLPANNLSLEASDSLAEDAEWQVIGGPLPGVGRIMTWDDPAPLPGRRFYRLRAEAP